MKRFNREQILEFLTEIDDHLDEPVAMEIIGGAAALLAYGAQSPTKDIDSFAGIDERIWKAAALASQVLLHTIWQEMNLPKLPITTI